MAPLVASPPHQGSLFAGGDPTPTGVRPTRLHLDDTSWIDHAPGWLAGADTLFAILAGTLAWRRRRRPMYGVLVDEPRLSAPVDPAADRTPPVVAAIARRLAEAYDHPLDAVWANYYRDGRDSVAWHADRIGRHRVHPIVAIVSLGGPRRFALRPRGGSGTVRLPLASGDLLVMGGACQHDWEHAVPKAASAQPRISLTFRPAGPGVPRPRSGPAGVESTAHEDALGGRAQGRSHPQLPRHEHLAPLLTGDAPLEFQ